MSSNGFGDITNANIMDAFRHAAGLTGSGRRAEAAQLWRDITRAAPSSAEARVNLAAVLMDLGQFGEAESALRTAVSLKPDAPWSHRRLANLLHATGRWREALASYERALALEPQSGQTKLDLGHLRLGLGDYAAGWPLYEARKGLAGQNSEPLPLPDEWQGEPLAGRSILVWPEQGFGDQIQFARFVPQLAAQGADVTLVAPPELAPLFQALPAKVVEQTPQLTLPQPDTWTLLGSIPHRLGVTLQTLPAEPYLQAPQDRRDKWAGHAPKGAVGIVWEGRATPNPHRSLPSREALKPLEEAGAQLFDLYPPPGDFADMAAVMEQLDLIVTVDTAAAHLAGALGKPCFILLPWFKTDWRWMQQRSDSPWYPSARLFRQPRHGDWAPVIAEVVEAWRAGDWRERGAT